MSQSLWKQGLAFLLHSTECMLLFSVMSEITSRLYIGNLAYSADKKDLRALFAMAGQVVDVYTPFQEGHEFKRNRGYGFVEMGTAEEAERAIEMFDGEGRIRGRVIQVKTAENRQRNE